MATETMAEGYVYLWDGDKDSESGGTITYTSYCLKIRAQKIERNMIRDIIIFKIPQTETDSLPITKFIDFNRSQEVITITGYLKTDGADTLAIKRDNLVAMGRTGVNVGGVKRDKAVAWGLDVGDANVTANPAVKQKETVVIQKFKINEEASQGTKKIPVVINLVVAEAQNV